MCPVSDQSKIEWTDATWNVVIGCDKVSPGCDNCYAIRTAHRFQQHPNPKVAAAYAGTERDGEWTGRVNLVEDRLNLPLTWKRPRRIFVNAQSDLFHPDVPDGFIARVWEVMAHAPHHTFQILTKRPGRMRSWLKRWHDNTGDDQVAGGGLPPMPRGPDAVRDVYSSPRALLFADMLESMGTPPAGAAYPLYDWMEGPRWFPGVLPNVWVGVSVEDQDRVFRVEKLQDTPAAVRFVSAEPLLGPVDLINGLGDSWLTDIDWVIVGGESGPGARPMRAAWVRSLRDQCEAAGVAFFFKQWGDQSLWRDRQGDVWQPEEDGLMHAPETAPFSRDHVERKWGPLKAVPNKAAGRLLDGRTWDEYPREVAAHG